MKRLSLSFVMLIVFVFVFTVPVDAGNVEPIGPWLSRSDVTFPANTPFHIMHGWNSTGMENPHPQLSYKYALDMDGVPLKFDNLNIYEDPDTDMWYWLWTYNFPEGLSGTHTFTHHWYGHCKEFIQDCNSNMLVEINQETQTVDFISD